MLMARKTLKSEGSFFQLLELASNTNSVVGVLLTIQEPLNSDKKDDGVEGEIISGPVSA